MCGPTYYMWTPGDITPADCGAGRELSLANTKVEEAVMWAVKGITK